VVFIATTNLLSTMDKAFLDRCSIKKQIPNPTDNASFEIVRRVINKSISQGLVYCDSLVLDKGDARNEDDMGDAPRTVQEQDPQAKPSSCGKPTYIPHLVTSDWQWSNDAVAVPTAIQRLAQRGRDVSARKWHHLVNWARYEHTVKIPCEIRELLAGLEKVLKEELGHAYDVRASTAEERSDIVGEVVMEDAEEICRRMFPDHHGDESV
jgi:SpoVK/Ycf46/Vps4 family AAA+-type ATPase